MYNGIGLRTARGTGTSGHVQRNLAAVRRHRKREREDKDIISSKAKHARKANEELLAHERRRRIEVAVAELEEELAEKGFSAEEMTNRVDQLRQDMAKESETKNVIGKVKSVEVHKVAALQRKRNENLRAALKLPGDYEEGQAFARMTEEAQRRAEAATKENVDDMDTSNSKTGHKSIVDRKNTTDFGASDKSSSSSVLSSSSSSSLSPSSNESDCAGEAHKAKSNVDKGANSSLPSPSRNDLLNKTEQGPKSVDRPSGFMKIPENRFQRERNAMSRFSSSSVPRQGREMSSSPLVEKASNQHSQNSFPPLQYNEESLRDCGKNQISYGSLLERKHSPYREGGPVRDDVERRDDIDRLAPAPARYPTYGRSSHLKRSPSNVRSHVDDSVKIERKHSRTRKASQSLSRQDSSDESSAHVRYARRYRSSNSREEPSRRNRVSRRSRSLSSESSRSLSLSKRDSYRYQKRSIRNRDRRRYYSPSRSSSRSRSRSRSPSSSSSSGSPRPRRSRYYSRRRSRSVSHSSSRTRSQSRSRSRGRTHSYRHHSHRKSRDRSYSSSSDSLRGKSSGSSSANDSRYKSRRRPKVRPKHKRRYGHRSRSSSTSRRSRSSSPSSSTSSIYGHLRSLRRKSVSPPPRHRHSTRSKAEQSRR